MKRLIFVALLLGCAGKQIKHPGPYSSTAKEHAKTVSGMGILSGYAGCVAGFAGAGPWAFATCAGGWALYTAGEAYQVFAERKKKGLAK